MTHFDSDDSGVDYSADESAADEIPSDFDDVDASGAEQDAATPRRPQLPGESLINSGTYFILHRPGTLYNRMPAVAASINQAHRDLNVIVSATLPRLGTTRVKEYFESFGTDGAALRIADPEGFALPGDVIGDPELTEAQQTKVRYVGSVPGPSDSSSDHTSWNRRVVNTQRAAGANLMMTPGVSLDPSAPADSIHRAERELYDLLDNLGEDELPIWNLSIGSIWLVDEGLRNQLLAELVDREEISTWHVRVYWPLIKRTYGQTLDARVLAGYKELATTAAREEKVLLLPNSGVTGWMAMAWGASGYGAGSSSATQAWAAHPRIAARKGVERSTVNRYFSRPLLHTITVETHDALIEGLGENIYPVCGCQFCQEQAQDATWRKELAAQHAAFSFGDMAGSALTAPDRSAHIRGVIRRATELLGAVPDAYSLAPTESPEHLDVWSANRLP